MSSSSESEEELGIIATRERRANAGSRLKQLLQQEELDAGIQGFEQDDDDENVNLLFQEDENDDEFVEDDEEEEEGEEEEEEEDDDEQENLSSRKATSEEPNDEMFSSESEVSASDSDESEGERELRREEKLKRKKKAERAKFVPPVINKSSTTKTKPKTKVTADSFLKSSIRASTRKSAVENKLAIVERLKEEEERKSNMKPVIRKEVVALTQKERLAEAKTTERTNVLSLNKFHEQELERKEKQKQMMLNRRKKLTNVLRFYSASALIYPVDELNDMEKVKKMEAEFMKSHKKRIYKKRKKKTDENKEEVKPETSENKTDTNKDQLAEGENNLNSENTVEQEDDSVAKDSEQQATDSSPESSQNKTDTVIEVDSSEDKDVVMKDATEPTEMLDSNKSPLPVSEENVEKESFQSKEFSKPTEDINNETEAVGEPSLKAKKVSFNEENSQLEFSTESPVASLINNNTKETDVKLDVNQTSVKQEPSEATIETETEQSPQPDKKEEITESKEEELLYEGPPQFVARNKVELLEFSKKLTKLEYTKYVLGDQAVLPAQRRTSHLKPLIRIKQQPTLIETLFSPYSSTHEKEFHEILTLPKFGEENKTVHRQLLVKESDTKKIEIITPAPIGIYLPNGSKKLCPISGKPASYFDPKNGVPYASVEAYKVLKDVQDEQFTWIQPDKGGEYSRYKGGIGAYLQRWDVKHAKGVPDWF